MDRPFTYELPAELEAGIGSLVQVRFHGKLVRGWVLGSTDDIPPRLLKVHRVVSPIRFFDQRMLELLRSVSERYVAPLASVIARSHPPRVASEEGQAAAVSRGALRSFDSLRSSQSPRSSAPPALQAYRHGREVLERIVERSGGTFRLRPVPEQEQQLPVDAVQSCLAAGRAAIVIVPEADPIPATARSVVDAFGDRVAMWLGGDKRHRYRMWLDIQGGRYDVIVGTRAAVFGPVENLGLIWLSRESHALHREERSPYFHVREVAAQRARIEGATFVMSALCHSTDASVMTAVDVTPATRAWPPVEVVRPGPEGRAPRLVGALKEARRAFLYEPLPGLGVARVCRSCGEPAACAECGGVLRLAEGRVRCTVCEAEGHCARCGSIRFGIVRGGAERVEQWLRGLVSVPVRRTERFGRSEGVVVGGPEAVKDVGPLALDLVGILDADLAARRPGLTAVEQSVAVWMEAAGWARPSGRVIVQTNHPADPAIQALVQGNPARFQRTQLEQRGASGFPVGHPVFRVSGGPELAAELRAVGPAHLLEASLGDETVCLLTIRPETLTGFGRTVRRLAERGIVTRVEAEPHL